MNLVLDTHVWVWLMLGDPTMSARMRNRIEEAARVGGVIIPAISVWEVSMLEMKGRLVFTSPISHWVKSALSKPGLRLGALTPEISVESCNLPGEFHGDPSDRMIVATTRIEDALLMTRDKKILEYGGLGHVNVMEV